MITCRYIYKIQYFFSAQIHHKCEANGNGDGVINAPIVGYNCHEQFADKLLQALNITLPTDPPMIGNTINQSQETPYRLDFFDFYNLTFHTFTFDLQSCTQGKRRRKTHIHNSILIDSLSVKVPVL